MRAVLARGIALSGVGLLTVSQPAAAQTPLDGFLTMDRPCDGSAAYETFVKSLNDRYNFDGPRSGRVLIPAEIEKSFGTPNAVKNSEYTEVVVPVLGATYHDISVQEMRFYFGHSNGIAMRDIVFSVDLDTAKRQLGRVVKKANAKLRREMADVGGPDALYVRLVSQKNGSKLTCDLST